LLANDQQQHCDQKTGLHYDPHWLEGEKTICVHQAETSLSCKHKALTHGDSSAFPGIVIPQLCSNPSATSLKPVGLFAKVRLFLPKRLGTDHQLGRQLVLAQMVKPKPGSSAYTSL